MGSDIDDGSSRLKRPLRHAMGVLYVGAGVLHFVVPKLYARIVPPQFPRPLALVYLSGIAEVALGIVVALRRTRRLSAWGIIALLVAVFPANVYMATSGMATDAVPDWADSIARVAAWVRLPLQGVLILWAWWYTHSPSESSSEN